MVCTGVWLQQKWQSSKYRMGWKEWINSSNPGVYPKHRQLARIQHSVDSCVVIMTKHRVALKELRSLLMTTHCPEI